MKRIILAALFALGLNGPALAGITQITGSGTGGAIGTANAAAGGTTVVVTTNVAVPPGSLIAIALGVRTAGSYSGCTDSAGNTYATPLNKTTTGQTTSTTYSYTTVNLPSGGTITCTSPNTSNKGMIAAAFSATDSSPLDAASATPTNGSGTTISVGPTGTLACPSVSGNCELLFAAWSDLGIGTITEDANFTNLGTQTGNSGNTHAAFKLVTANTAVSYSAGNTTSNNWAAYLQAFKAATGGGGPTLQGGTLLRGAGR